MSKAGKRLIAAAEEALAIAHGKANSTTYKIHVPDEIDVRGIRDALGLSQSEFGARFGFGAGNVKDWEQGRTRPSAAARTFLLVIQREPDAVDRALGPERYE